MSARTRTRRRGHAAGFTLIELLAAITVLAILAGILTPVILRSLQTSQEATVTIEMQNLNRAVEDFKTHFGFYPPTIGNDATFEVNSAADMLRYLNRLSPNHGEGNGTVAGTGLFEWWDKVGRNLNEKSSLVFWLSGVCKNKQFPLSGSQALVGTPLAPFATDKDYTGAALGTTIERDVRFGFDAGRLVVPAGESFPAYIQGYGDDSQDLAFRYRDHKSYGDYSDPLLRFAYFNNIAGGFMNPKSFQLVSLGMDGLPGSSLDVFNAGPQADDNICNFAEGRLDKYVNNNQ